MVQEFERGYKHAHPFETRLIPRQDGTKCLFIHDLWRRGISEDHFSLRTGRSWKNSANSDRWRVENL